MSQLMHMDLDLEVNHNTFGVSFHQDLSLRDIEKTVILETLRRQHFNRTKTAKVLGIGIRTLQRKIKQYREMDGEVILEFKRA